jgi:glycosyltransferase involved in cell wall biosynthesis
MRILHVVQELGAGGAEQVVRALTSTATREGHTVAVATAPASIDDFEELRFPLPIVARSPWRLPEAAFALDRAVRRFDPDVVHVHNPGMAAVATLVTLRGHRLPTLVTMHGVDERDYPAAARVLRLSGLRIVACGPGVADALRASGVRVQMTIVNGISPPPSPADRTELMRSWHLDPDRPLVVSVGRLVEQKDHALALRAVARLPEHALAIVGKGPLDEDLRREAMSLQIADRVVLTGERPDAREIMGAADAVVLSSRWEGLPLVALEALAAGVPLVAMDVRGLRELLTDGVDALLVRDRDGATLATAIERAVSDEPSRLRLTANGRRTAARYTEDEMGARYLALYTNLLSA